MQYPKILHIGQTFNKNSGGGITISNLFKGWPKESLAVATNFNLSAKADTSVCENYYQLGYNGKLHPFPLNIFLPKIKTGKVNFESINNINPAKTKKGRLTKLYSLISLILNFIGIYNVFYKLKITPEFKKWLFEFNPDIVYSQLSTLELIRFVSEIQQLTNKPVIIHIMDDWPAIINKPGILYFYWKKVIDREFRNLLDKSTVLMSICDTMSEEYRIRYGKDFIPFHNPIETSNWLPYAKKDCAIKDKFTILYAGRIGRGIEKSISDIADAVNLIYKTNNKIIFEVQTFDIDRLNKIIRFNEHIKRTDPIEYADLPKKFASVDLLVLPEDFDSESIEFLKFSIQTKVAEYMISGTPILVYADERTALAKYALKDGWAYVVSHNNIDELTRAINELSSNYSLRRSLAETARKTALKNEDAEIVREKFRKCFILN